MPADPVPGSTFLQYRPRSGRAPIEFSPSSFGNPPLRVSWERGIQLRRSFRATHSGTCAMSGSTGTPELPATRFAAREAVYKRFNYDAAPLSEEAYYRFDPYRSGLTDSPSATLEALESRRLTVTSSDRMRVPTSARPRQPCPAQALQKPAAPPTEYGPFVTASTSAPAPQPIL